MGLQVSEGSKEPLRGFLYGDTLLGAVGIGESVEMLVLLNAETGACRLEEGKEHLHALGVKYLNGDAAEGHQLLLCLGCLGGLP